MVSHEFLRRADLRTPESRNRAHAPYERFLLCVVEVAAIPSEEIINPVDCRYRNVHGVVQGSLRQRTPGDQALCQSDNRIRHLQIGNLSKFLAPCLCGIGIALTGLRQD
jgi:hypothetical protein